MTLLVGATFLVSFTFASEVNPRIKASDQAIAQGKITVDRLLSTMQTIHEGQKADVTEALAAGNQAKVEKTLKQWSELYPLTTHLYDLKSGD